MTKLLDPWLPGDERVPPGAHLHDGGLWYHEHPNGGQYHEHERLPWNAHKTKNRPARAHAPASGLALIILGIVAVVYFNHNYVVCGSALNRALADNQAPCTVADFAHYAGIVMIILGVLYEAAAIFQRRRP